MNTRRPPLFRKRKFEPIVIVTCVRWYCRFALSLRDLEELMAERGLSVDHTTIWRWTQAYGPEVYRRLSGEVKRKSSTWHMDETFVRIAGKWMYLFRAVDSQGQTVDFYLSETRDREAAKLFLRQALGESRQSSAVRVGQRRSAQLSRGHSRTPGRRTIASHVSTAHWPLLQ
jgi:transposase, IS6 family